MILPPKRRFWIQALAWFAAAFAVRLVHLAFAASSPLFRVPTSDEFELMRLARHLAGGDWAGLDWGAFFRPELFSYVLAILLKITGGSLTAIHVILAAMDSAAVALMWVLARQIFSRRAAFWGALACLAYSSAVHFSATFYMESFALLVQAAMLLAAVRAVRLLSQNVAGGGNGGSIGGGNALVVPRETAWAGFLAGLMILTRPTVQITVPWMAVCLFAAAWVWRRAARGRANEPPKPDSLDAPDSSPTPVDSRDSRGSWRTFLAAPLLFLAMIPATLLPNAARNYLASGQWIWVGSNGAVNLYFGNNDRGLSPFTCSPGLEWRLFVDAPAVEDGIGADRAARMAWWQKRFLEYVRRDPLGFAGQYARKCIQTLNREAVAIPCNIREGVRISPVQRFLPGFALLGTIGLAGAILFGVRAFFFVRKTFWRNASAENRFALLQFSPDGWRADRVLASIMLLGYAVLYLAGVALVHVTERHRMPAACVLFLFGGAYVSEWLIAWRARQWSLVAAGALALAIVAAGITCPPFLGAWHERQEDFWTRVNLGTADLGMAGKDAQPDSKWLKEARGNFLEAHLAAPNRLEPINQLALVASRRERSDEALRWNAMLLRLLRRDYPRHRDVISDELAHRALIAFRANQPEIAEQAARELVALLPGDPRAHHYLGVALMAQGKYQAARSEFQIVLGLDPTQTAARENLRQIEKALAGEPQEKPPESPPEKPAE